jgi:hypothetical protein
LQTDIGTPPFVGTAFSLGNTLTIKGAGDINNDVDSGHQIYQESSSDFEVCSVVSELVGDSVYAAAGPSIRDLGPTEDARYCWMRADRNNMARFQWKDDPADFFDEHSDVSAVLPYAFRIVQSGGTCSGYIGTTCATANVLVGSAAIPFSGTKFFGVSISSGGPTEALATATMSMPTLTAVGGSPGTVQFTTANQAQAENITPFVVSVSRASGNSGAGSVIVSRAGSSNANAGTDYTDPPFPVTLNWSGGETSDKTINLVIADRVGVQTSRHLDLTLGTAMGVSLGSPQSQINTIQDNDGALIRVHSGHYAWYHPQVPGSAGFWMDVPAVLAEEADFLQDTVCANPNVKGARIFFTWAALEGDIKGDYAAGIARVQNLGNILENCPGGRKYMILSGPLVGYAGGVPSRLTVWPAYLVATAEGGTDNTGTYGVIDGTPGYYAMYPRIWTSATANALKDLYAAYGAAFDGQRWLEMVEIAWESSFNITGGTGGFSYAGVETQLSTILPAMRAAFPHTNLRLPLNYIDNNARMTSEISMAANSAVAIGGPDTIPHENIQANSGYVGEFGGTDYRPITPFISEVESPELCDAKDSKPNADANNNYTMTQFLNHAMVGNASAGIAAVQPTWFLWYVDQHEFCNVANQWWGAAPPNWVDQNTGGMLDLIQTNPPLSTTCRTSYSSVASGCDTAP